MTDNTNLPLPFGDAALLAKPSQGTQDEAGIVDHRPPRSAPSMLMPKAGSGNVEKPVGTAAVEVDALPEDGTRSPGVWTLDESEPAFQLLGERIAAITGQQAELSIHSQPKPPEGQASPIPLPPRYTWLGPLGEGGQGSVELVQDHDLGRPLALKTLLPHKRSGDHLLDLYREARITGQLDHPQIIRIYDVGQLPDGRLYYTMPRMPGASLHDVLVLLRRGDTDTVKKWDLPALVSALEKACHGVGYAHSFGVIHRDLKPANILLGSHGEVLVVDWGIARVLEPKSGEDSEPALLWSRTGEVRKERVRGSPPYMAPEQIQHPNQVTPAADVFCLGVILYEALTGGSPFPGKDVDTIVRGVCHGRPVPPRERAPGRNIPAELEEICLRAIEKFPGHRFATAGEFASALSNYLAGGRRKEQSARRLKEARSMHERLKTLAQRQSDAQQNLASMNTPRVENDESSRDLATLKEESQSLRRAADGVFTEGVWALHKGLSDTTQNPELQELVGEFYAERYAEAERRGNESEVPLYRAMINAGGDSRWRSWLGSGCELGVHTLPLDVPIELLRMEERGGRLRISESLGTLPERTCLTLAPGHYALAPALDGGETESLSVPRRWVYPVLLERGDRRNISLDLRGEEGIGEAFAYIPGGPTLLGGDPAACGSGARRSLSLPPFAIARHPVTVGAYDRFLSSIRQESLAIARQRRPKDFEAQLRNGVACPVVGVSLDDALAYAAWLAAATGRIIRLPSADEWEKSVRGADGRPYPWGSEWGRSFCASVLTCQPSEFPPKVGTFAEDTSPFGVCDTAGGVWEWTADRQKGNAVVVGGSIVSESGGCRVAGRRSLTTSSRIHHLGFRVLMEILSAPPM